MIMFFDTETTGFYQKGSAVDDPTQPYVVQLAAQLCEDEGDVVSSFNFIVNNDVDIPEQAAKIHGITTQKACEFGVGIEFAMAAFSHLYHRSDLIVAHNIAFDKQIMETAIARHYKATRPITKPMFCTMKAASPIINLPPTDRMIAAGINKPKAPKLEECIKHFFDEDLEGAHDAMVDVAACHRVYFHLKGLDQ